MTKVGNGEKGQLYMLTKAHSWLITLTGQVLQTEQAALMTDMAARTWIDSWQLFL